jgi:hypothetical protein
VARTGHEVKGRFERDDKDATFELAGFDYQVIARQIVASRTANNKQNKTVSRSPKVANLSDSITSVTLHDTYLRLEHAGHPAGRPRVRAVRVLRHQQRRPSRQGRDPVSAQHR